MQSKPGRFRRTSRLTLEATWTLSSKDLDARLLALRGRDFLAYLYPAQFPSVFLRNISQAEELADLVILGVHAANAFGSR